MLPRTARGDVDLHGNTIRPGQTVQLSIVSANRDAAHFPEPDWFDIGREPGRILSFGYGPHGCIGGHLARDEARIALTTLFRRMPKLRLDESKQIQWYRNAGNRGPSSHPIVF